MKSKPFSIRIFLPNGEPDGLRIVEKSNWTGIGLVFPKSLLPEIKKREEFERTGIYILYGNDEGETGSEFPRIYIGQGDPVRPRIEQHFLQKTFWDRAVFFTTRDDSLNKAHIGHLETRLIALADETKRATLDNGNYPNPSPLSEADSADMDSFLEDILNILPILGLNVFQKPATSASHELLYFNTKGVSATGYVSNQGFVVKKGSQIFGSINDVAEHYKSKLLEQLIKQNVILQQGTTLTLQQDYTFNSSSEAASLIRGGSTSGPASWKNAMGISLRDIQAAEIETK